MATTIGNTMGPVSTRRWPRYRANLPVSISSTSDGSRVVVPGLASEISQAGMALYGGLPLEPGDLMEIEFQTSGRLRITGVVRNRSGYCFGLEFLSSTSSTSTIANLVAPDSSSGEAALPLASLAVLRWRTWLTEHRGDFAVALASILLLLALSGWTSRSAQNPTPAQAAAQPSLTLVEQMLVNLGWAEPPPAPMLKGNPNARVWVDLHTALYYCTGSELYGKTPNGRIATQRDAQLDQFEPAARNYCQ